MHKYDGIYVQTDKRSGNKTYFHGVVSATDKVYLIRHKKKKLFVFKAGPIKIVDTLHIKDLRLKGYKLVLPRSFCYDERPDQDTP